MALSMRKWYWVHRWSSLICTLFLLVVCITGLPLIFLDEISEQWRGDPPAAELSAHTPLVNLDQLVASAIGKDGTFPGETVRWLSMGERMPIGEMESNGAQSHADHREHKHLPGKDAEVHEAAGDDAALHQQIRQANEQQHDGIQILREDAGALRRAACFEMPERRLGDPRGQPLAQLRLGSLPHAHEHRLRQGAHRQHDQRQQKKAPTHADQPCAVDVKRLVDHRHHGGTAKTADKACAKSHWQLPACAHYQESEKRHSTPVLRDVDRRRSSGTRSRFGAGQFVVDSNSHLEMNVN